MKPFRALCFLALVVHPLAVLAQQEPEQTPKPKYSCKPFGICEPCPDDALHEPFCQPFGNRRLMHCVPAGSSNTTAGAEPVDAGDSLDPTDPAAGHTPGHVGEIPAWESCGRIVEKERADFFEFFASNFFVGAAAVFVLLARSKRLQAMQARQLAARIGVSRSVPGGWVNG